MPGAGSIQLGRVLGIRIGASPSWFLVLFLMIYLLSGYFEDVLDASSSVAYLVAVSGAFCFFASLVLHELGHALAARRAGIEITGIDLWFFGGLAKMARDTRSPGEELSVAAAGPLATLAVVVLCVVGGTLGASYGEFEDAALLAGDDTTPALAILGWLAVVNTFLLAFNLIPAYPLDGGRIARAIAWRVTGDRHRATRASGLVGQAFAMVLIGGGIFLALSVDPLNGIWLVVLGWFLLQGARSAVLASAFSERLEGVTAGDLMEADPVVVRADARAIDAQDEVFLRYRVDHAPLVDPDGRFAGVLTAGQVDDAVVAGRPAQPVGELVAATGWDDWRIAGDMPLEALLAYEPLRRLGALAVLDGDGRVVGTLTADRVRRAIAATAAVGLKTR